jgi:hypothetical protein
MALDWRRHRPKGGSLAASDTSIETAWDEGFDVINYVPPVGSPAWIGLIVDRPWLFPGSVHPTVLSAYVTNFKADPLGLKGWRVTVSYRVGDPKELDLPPLMRAAEVEIETESVEVPTFTQHDGTPWLNEAGDLIAGLTRYENHVIFKITKNVATVPAWFLTMADSAVNNDAFSIKGLAIAAEYAMLKQPRAGKLTKEIVNGVPYVFYPIGFEIHYHPATWKTRVYNRGLYQIDTTKYPDGGGYGPCVDDEGEPATEPCFLDAAGKQLPFPVNPASIVTLEGWNSPLMSFAALPLT